ncbi:MAG: topoisomerase [Panacagrimonas sp.]|jgi:DNA topoisomerase IB|nr:topoisomerase [Panacagrimonas sp.]
MAVPVAMSTRRRASRPAQHARRAARVAGLRHVGDDAPGIVRLGVPGAFCYRSPRGRPVRDASTLRRIAQLAIPPAYENVWICTDPRGHLQATGRDARGRKQYRYHPDWRVTRDTHKFDRLLAFGDALPAIRRRVRRDLATRGLHRDKVLALIVALLDATRLRIGNNAYERDNRSYGLTTLRDRHADFRGGRLRLSFRGKGGAEHDLVVDDRRLARIVRRCHDLPGQRLFQFLEPDGTRRPVDSGMVNDYLREVTGRDFTAKDFRTWGATMGAIARLACLALPDPPSERAAKACINDVIREVAGELRNTPAVCRKSYIDPLVFEGWLEGRLHRRFTCGTTMRPRAVERRALAFLRAEARRAEHRNGR